MRALRRSDRGCACRFCCAGCAAAYQIVTGLGLDRYYDGRLRLLWRGTPERARELLDLARSLGYRAVPYDPQRLSAATSREERSLLRAMAVAGFAAGNIMLLSIAVWAGNAGEMGSATRDLLHWVSALIAVPAVACADTPFFASAVNALFAGRTNMDVPISVGVILATGMSLFETLHSGLHTYFDSAVTLLFFLLIGRYLEPRARGRARPPRRCWRWAGRQSAGSPRTDRSRVCHRRK